MLDDDPRHARIGEQPGETRALRTETRTHLGHDLVDRQPVLARPQAHAAGPRLEILSLVLGAHPAIDDGPTAGCLGITCSTTTVADGSLRAGTGIVPSWNHR